MFILAILSTRLHTFSSESKVEHRRVWIMIRNIILRKLFSMKFELSNSSCATFFNIQIFAVVTFGSNQWLVRCFSNREQLSMGDFKEL